MQPPSETSNMGTTTPKLFIHDYEVLTRALGDYCSLLSGIGWTHVPYFIQGTLLLIRKVRPELSHCNLHWRELVETDSFFMPYDSTEEEIIAEASFKLFRYLIERYPMEIFYTADDVQVEIHQQEIHIYVFTSDS